MKRAFFAVTGKFPDNPPQKKRNVMIAPSPSPIKASVAAAVHLLSIELAAGAAVPTTAAQAIKLAGAGRSQAYSMLGRLRAGVETLARPAGRPAEPKADSDTLVTLAKSVISFLKEHPGCCTNSDGRGFYHDDFRRFVVGLFAPGGPAVHIPIGQVAHAIDLPLGTLKDWLHVALSGPASTPLSQSQHQGSPAEPIFSTTEPQIATLLAEYPNWKGTLSGFCEYARTELGLPFGRGFITTVLSAAGLHTLRPRNRPHQAPWSRGAMRRDFPGMQWFGDGKQLAIVLRGERFTFNLEAFVDGATAATVGAIVSATEDAQAVVDAFHDGLCTVEGQIPMAVTLDNRPSNDAPEVEQTLSCCELLHATPARGQAKAPVEGAFGLFEQALPSPLVVSGDTDQDIAASISELVSRAYFLGRNGRPTSRLEGRTPADSYMDACPTEEQIEDAKQWILELRRREEVARTTRLRRTDPIRRDLLRTELARLEIDDPKGKIALSLAGYSMDAIVTGIALFEAKRQQGTLPENCLPDRYLGGIIRNVEEREFIERTARKLLELRLGVNDKQLAPLRAQAADVEAAANGPVQHTHEFVLRALQADSTIAFRFWSSRALDAIGIVHPSEVEHLCIHLGRMIAASFRVDIKRRERFLADLMAAAVPVAA
ncbi:MAG: hypothetical protein K0B16_16690 [Burkholderiaceae bacterium]|nr:hypothetical protein [Burkholderiaceae bacterium]